MQPLTTSPQLEYHPYRRSRPTANSTKPQSSSPPSPQTHHEPYHRPPCRRRPQPLHIFYNADIR
ncbi:uncharacterized protein P174DRAFT_440563, partial [Aspergillus novofumigatus IBT 16806]